jgi:hypothetical protein
MSDDDYLDEQEKEQLKYVGAGSPRDTARFYAMLLTKLTDRIVEAIAQLAVPASGENVFTNEQGEELPLHEALTEEFKNEQPDFRGRPLKLRELLPAPVSAPQAKPRTRSQKKR